MKNTYLNSNSTIKAGFDFLIKFTAVYSLHGCGLADRKNANSNIENDSNIAIAYGLQESKEENWSCPLCDYSNTSLQKCNMCDTVNPNIGQKHITLKEEKKIILNQAHNKTELIQHSPSSSWKCKNCNNWNNCQKDICSACKGKKIQSISLFEQNVASLNKYISLNDIICYREDKNESKIFGEVIKFRKHRDDKLYYFQVSIKKSDDQVINYFYDDLIDVEIHENLDLKSVKKSKNIKSVNLNLPELFPNDGLDDSVSLDGQSLKYEEIDEKALGLELTSKNQTNLIQKALQFIKQSNHTLKNSHLLEYAYEFEQTYPPVQIEKLFKENSRGICAGLTKNAIDCILDSTLYKKQIKALHKLLFCDIKKYNDQDVKDIYSYLEHVVMLHVLIKSKSLIDLYGIYYENFSKSNLLSTNSLKVLNHQSLYEKLKYIDDSSQNSNYIVHITSKKINDDMGHATVLMKKDSGYYYYNSNLSLEPNQFNSFDEAFYLIDIPKYTNDGLIYTEKEYQFTVFKSIIH